MGVMDQTFPQDNLWTMLGDEKNHTFHLSAIGIKAIRITKALTAKKTKPPNCEKAWEVRLNRKLPWTNQIWLFLGTSGITNPRDEKQYHRILHRKLAVDTNDSRVTSLPCRLCKSSRGSMLHLPACPTFGPVKTFTTKLLL